MLRILMSLLSLASLLILSNSAMAFHSGGVAECEGCHTMHNSLDGVPMITKGTLTQYQSGPYLLNATDQSSVCLNCHEGTGQQFNISTPASVLTPGSSPLNFTPGGDFGWLKKTYSWTTSEGSFTSPGDRHGHNIVSADYNFSADSTQTTSPGGSYPGAQLSCISCHDPHGKYRYLTVGGNETKTGGAIWSSGSYGATPKTVNGQTLATGVYRLLGGAGYLPASMAGSGNDFTQAAPYAVAPSTYNALETTYSGTKVAYGFGTSEWCANCHVQMHSTLGSDNYVHPVNQAVPGTMATSYNAYISSGNLTGTKSTAYLSLVPFQSDNSKNQTNLLSKAGNTIGMDNGDRVTCFSCHRAHAGGFDSITRWGNGHEFVTVLDDAGQVVYPGTDTTPTTPERSEGRTAAEVQQAYYGRPATLFGAYQRVLCNKCHAKD